ncbi:Eco29kI family restriction endonuclease [Streptomyces fagopyri]|uniref:Eco29kI family restriction endonuclease n=1 Tax=Streptomyces fagopyri TaxID=2662397 RepID=A0A5Q0LCR4_9ACTN|nr:Eco29kI family restriction endonuclease [Streptomyces fagopyri]QFZ74289.1 Eco29kI family restriction endonuclease [Streptomyces fagopyri]
MPTSSPAATSGPSHGRFNPLGLAHLSQNLRGALEDRPKVSLTGLQPFAGAGLYALYYRGDLPIYQRLSETDVPLYVGKAEAGNSSYGDPPNEQKPKLYDRIDKHRTSISEAQNLSASDFDVRYVVLDDVWIVLGERALLRSYSPVLWNTLLTGFGSNTPGRARTNPRSFWDTLHPGRPRAANNLCNRLLTRDEVETRVQEGISVSLMTFGPARDEALASLRRRKYQSVWSLPRKTDKDKRIVVHRPAAFLEENTAFGIHVEPDAWRATDTLAGVVGESIIDEADAGDDEGGDD